MIFCEFVCLTQLCTYVLVFLKLFGPKIIKFTNFVVTYTNFIVPCDGVFLPSFWMFPVILNLPLLHSLSVSH